MDGIQETATIKHDPICQSTESIYTLIQTYLNVAIINGVGTSTLELTPKHFGLCISYNVPRKVFANVSS